MSPALVRIVREVMSPPLRGTIKRCGKLFETYPCPGVDDPVNTPDFWEACYHTGEDQWDLGGPTPLFERVVQELEPGRICIIGCGRGWDAVTFAQAGFTVTAIDFAETAVLAARRNALEAGVEISVLKEDLFDLPDELHGQFDYLLEYICFCAVSPSRRFEYDRVAWQLLRSGGMLLGLFFPLDKPLAEGGPPWGVTISELHQLFSLHWHLDREETPVDSIDPRRGREVLQYWRKP